MQIQQFVQKLIKILVLQSYKIHQIVKDLHKDWESGISDMEISDWVQSIKTGNNHNLTERCLKWWENPIVTKLVLKTKEIPNIQASIEH